MAAIKRLLAVPAWKSCGVLLGGIVICPSENGHLTYTLSPGGRVCYLRNASGRRE
jgi:hypothetical protein